MKSRTHIERWEPTTDGDEDMPESLAGFIRKCMPEYLEVLDDSTIKGYWIILLPDDSFSIRLDRGSENPVVN